MTIGSRTGGLFLVNPRAGGGHAESRLRSMLRATKPFGGRFEATPVASIEDVCTALRSLESGVLPVVAGGDGTVAMVAAALDRLGLAARALGLVPLGTGNLLARELGIGRPRVALRALDSGPVRLVDVMRTSIPAAPVAVVSISGGFEGAFIELYARGRRRGRAIAALSALSRARSGASPVWLDVDGEVIASRGSAYNAGLYNTRFYAGGLVMSPEADSADGAGEAVVYRTASAYWRTLGAACCRLRRLPSEGVVRRPWRQARIESAGSLQVDGEPVGPGSLWVSLEPRALALIGGHGRA